jgi:hypothetical protein
MCRKEEYKIKNKYQIKRIQGKTKQNKKRNNQLGQLFNIFSQKNTQKTILRSVPIRRYPRKNQIHLRNLTKQKQLIQ